MIRVQRKRLLEHARELPHLSLERLLVRPRETWVQQLPRHALEMGGYRQPEGAKSLILCLCELARVHGVDDATGVLEWASFASAELARGPSGVDEPTIDLVSRHALREHFGVAARLERHEQKCESAIQPITHVQDDERCTVTSRECWNRLQNTVFRTGSFPNEERQRLPPQQIRNATHEVYPARK